MRSAVVELRDVFCVHRTSEGDAAALAGMQLTLGAGEILCVLGPSGAGKSTLLRVVAGIQVPSAGIVQVLGRDIGRLRARERARIRGGRIGFLGQHADAALPPDLPIADAVALPLALRGARAGDRRRRVEELLDAVGLGDRSTARPAELSGGERQRAALCLAVAHRPALLLADEPTGELDEASAQAIRALLAELAHSHAASVLIASHDAGTAAIADRTVKIRDGRAVEERLGGQSALVVGPGGWLQLPAGMLARAGIRDQVRVRPVAGGLILTDARNGSVPATGISPVLASGSPPASASSATAGTWRPAGSGAWRPAAVELRSLSRGRGGGPARREVIHDLTIEFAPGRMTVVRGRSGVGKTTLLRLIGGLDRPEDGELVLDGATLSRLGAEELASVRRERIGYLPQEPWPVGFLSAEENVVLALRLRCWDQSAAAARAAVALARVGLADRARQRVSRLSAGEGQRVALARALASARGLLVVDEPTSRLDEANATAVAALLASAAVDDHQTVICATHDPEVIARADEIVTLGD